MDKLARKKIVRARTQLVVGEPWWGCLSLNLELVEAHPHQGIQTMGVDGRHLFYWPEFVHLLSEQEIVGVVAHEVEHCARKHMIRRCQREGNKWNIAADCVINPDILDAGFSLPGKPRTVQEHYAGAVGFLMDRKYQGMSAEEAYAHLPDPPKQQSSGGNQQKQSSGNQGSSSGENSGKGGQKQSGNQNGSQNQPNGQNSPQNGADPGGCGGVMDAAPAHDQATLDKVANEWEANVRQALSTAKMVGNIPGYLERLLKELNKPRVNWRDQTRRFIDTSMSKDFSWSRPNRRSLGTGLLLPGYISDRLNHLVMVVDVSGSISPEMAKAMVSEAAGALDEGAADHLTVLYADTRVVHADEYQQGDIVEARVLAGGGTDFRNSFEWIRENAPDASCVVYLTDLLTQDFGDEPACPVMWAVWLPLNYYEQLAPKVPFGEPLHLDA